MAQSLGERLNATRRALFVGRESELEFLGAALRNLPAVVYIHGPGGTGKSALLQEFVARCDTSIARPICLDARDFEPTPQAFRAAFDSASQNASGQEARSILMLDTFELLAPLEPWLREEFLPSLSDDTLVVLAGRDALSAAWLSDAGWQSVLRPLELQNFERAESLIYLNKRNMPHAQGEAAIDWTHGHPLALCLLADLAARAPEDSRAAISDAPPQVVRVLLERLVREVPSPRHRAALEACALVRHTDEPILAAMIGDEKSTPENRVPSPASGYPARADTFSVHELFDWLRGLSFVQESALGIFPHDLAREVLNADALWRDAARCGAMEKRARGFYLARVGQRESQRALLDYIFLHRRTPALKPFLDWNSGDADFSVARESEIPKLMHLVEKHEGAESARHARFWLSAQPENAMVLRDASGEIAGFLLHLALQRIAQDEAQRDPAVRATCGYLERNAPLADGESATLFRFWMAADGYQDVSAVQSALSVGVIRHCLSTPGLAFSFLPCADATFWEAVFSYLGIARLPEADFAVGDRCFGVYGHDWRLVRPMQWLEHLAHSDEAQESDEEREDESCDDNHEPRDAPLPSSRAVLSRAEIAAALPKALRDLDRGALRESDLLRARFVEAEAGTDVGLASRVAALQKVLREACAVLELSPRDERIYRALFHTYLQPAPTQEQAAARLDAPFSTYRRHLKIGLNAVADWLWHRESE